MKKASAFETSITRLEEIVRLLEAGKEPLEESLKLFEEGAKLAAECNAALEKAEAKISVLTGDGQKEEGHEDI